MSRHNGLPGYDAWKTRSPDDEEYRFRKHGSEEQIARDDDFYHGTGESGEYNDYEPNSLIAAAQALLDWAREHTSPRDPNSPHKLLIDLTDAIRNERADSLTSAVDAFEQATGPNIETAINLLRTAHEYRADDMITDGSYHMYLRMVANDLLEIAGHKP